MSTSMILLTTSICLPFLAFLVRALRWRQITHFDPGIPWNSADSNSYKMRVDAILWYQALLDPARLVDTANGMAEYWVRQHVLEELLKRMNAVVGRLKAYMEHIDSLPGSTEPYIEIVLGVSDNLNDMDLTGAAMDSHLLEWFQSPDRHSDVMDVDLVGHNLYEDLPETLASAAEAVGPDELIGGMVLFRHGSKFLGGQKTAVDAIRDGAMEFGAKQAGRRAGHVVGSKFIELSKGHLSPWQAKLLEVAFQAGGKIAGDKLLKRLNTHELRVRKKALRKDVEAVGRELYLGERRSRVEELVWSPLRQDEAALRAISREVEVARREPAYWIWPSPRHVMFVRAERTGRDVVSKARQEAQRLSHSLDLMDQARKRDVLAGKMLLRSPKLYSELGISPELKGQVQLKLNSVGEEVDRLNVEYGYR